MKTMHTDSFALLTKATLLLYLIDFISCVSKGYCDLYHCNSHIPNNSTLNNITCVSRYPQSDLNRTISKGKYYYDMVKCPLNQVCNTIYNRDIRYTYPQDNTLVSDFSISTNPELCILAQDYEANIKLGTGLSGESCTTNEDCYLYLTCDGANQTTGKNGACTSIAEGKECNYTQQCQVGFACILNSEDNTTMTCQAQLEEGSKCENDYQCVNNLGCYNSSCIQYYTLDDNTYLSSKDEGRFCKSGLAVEVDSTKIICDRQSRISNYECSDNQNKCKYRWETSKIQFELDCRCKVASKEFRYCPPASVGIREAIKSGVHSINRFEYFDAGLKYIEKYYDGCFENVLYEKSFYHTLPSLYYYMMILIIQALFL